jgi:hypothetical protein
MVCSTVPGAKQSRQAGAFARNVVILQLFGNNEKGL